MHVINKTSVCIITCYKDPDYIRAITLRQGLLAQKNVDLTIIKNKRTGVLRYFEVIAKLIKARLTINPDIYLLTFRGYEMLLPVLFIGIGKKVVYDEFINPIEWVFYEHKKIPVLSDLIERITKSIYRLLLKRCDVVLTDTDSHADFSAELMRINRAKYLTIPVGTDEDTFKPITAKKKKDFIVFYYGNMLPLHGIDYVLNAALRLVEHGDIKFEIVGGDFRLERKAKLFRRLGANIHYRTRLPYKELPQAIAAAELCLGGPFGNTVQSQFVITGKTYQFLAMEKPVVVGANRESKAFSDRQNVLVVKQADDRALSKTILWAKNNPAELRTLGEHGRQLYVEKFSSKVVAGRISELLNRLN